jgi:GT2 family glycosyltransferase
MISVIIVNWNGKGFLADCLSALRRQTFRDFETILVDNGSTDGSGEFVRTEFPEVTVLPLSDNRGFTGGNIAGYAIARGELIVLLNNDTEADSHWLEEMHHAAQVYPVAGSFASKMMYFDERNRIENCGYDLAVAGTTIDLGRDEVDSPKWACPRSVFGACGGAAVYRRSMLEEVGFFDPNFFLIYEDVDLSFRARLRGYECIYIPGAVVYHRYRSSIGKAPARQVFFSQRNIEFVYLRNMPARLIFESAPQRLSYELGAALYFARRGAALSFVRAKLSALRCIGRVLGERRAIQRGRKISDAKLKSMLRKSFLAGKWKKFRAGWVTSPQKEAQRRPRSRGSL